MVTSYQEDAELVMCPIPWLYVSYRGYLWLYVVICMYVPKYVPKRCHNLQTMVLRGYTIKSVVIRPSPWLYQSSFSICVIILPGKARSGYVSHTVVIRLHMSHGYAWFYMVIYCNCSSKRSQNHVVATRHMRHLHVKRGRYTLSITL